MYAGEHKSSRCMLKRCERVDFIIIREMRDMQRMMDSKRWIQTIMMDSSPVVSREAGRPDLGAIVAVKQVNRFYWLQVELFEDAIFIAIVDC